MLTRPISLGTEGRQLIVSGSQCSYTLVIPKKEGKVKEIIHNCHDNSHDICHDKALLLIYVNWY